MTRCPICAEPAPCLKCVEPPVVNQVRALLSHARDYAGVAFMCGFFALAVLA